MLFRSEFRESLVFKGGTSLSKIFRVIERFSEDIDLSVSPSLLGLPEAGASRNQADKWMTVAQSACTEAVQDQFQPALEAEVRGVLGKPERGAWFEFAATEPAIADIEACKRVVGWKRLFFGSAWANYDSACPGSFRLLPSDARIPALRSDFIPQKWAT